MLSKALLYYSYSRLAQALLRSAVYDDYDGGKGTGPFLREVFEIRDWKPCHSKLALIANSRAAELEKALLDTVDRNSKSLKIDKYVPILLTLCVLTDQLDR